MPNVHEYTTIEKFLGPSFNVKNKNVKIQIRMVEDRKEVQMEIAIYRVSSGGRLYQEHASVQLTFDEANLLGQALMGLR
jgi:hypothetical protein